VGFLDWFRRGKKPQAEDTPAAEASPGVPFELQPTQTASKTTPVFVSSEDEKERLVRETFKFADYRIEGVYAAGIDRKDTGYVYEVYKCQSYSTALQFLRSIPFSEIPSLYYIIVETPSGNIGKDVEVIFDEASGDTIS